MNRLPDFRGFFLDLWAHESFPWQAMLADRISRDPWPQALDLPTASGKTACIDVAIHALASQAERPLVERTAPRRIWFVVDRRIVVDEAHVLHDDGWARLPSQPAVITSTVDTVDQLRSRLLFRGYGHRLLTASIFAGLSANDSLIFLHEAHCSVPFLQTLRAIERYRGAEWAEAPIPSPFAFVVLSATPPADIPSEAIFPGAERDQALDHPLLRERLRASKLDELVEVTNAHGMAEDPLVVETVKRAKEYVKTGSCGVILARTRDRLRRLVLAADRHSERAA